jgi:uncharacterized protein YbcI
VAADGQSPVERPAGEVLASISNGVVHLMREAIGKGPTQCKTHWAGPDILLVVLGGGFLASEQTLYAGGHGDEVRAGRRALQEILEAKMKEIVEGEVGRPVVAFMSAQNQGYDTQVEIFFFEPAEPASSPGGA